MKFRRQFDPYVNNRKLTKEENKSIVVPGQSVPMSLLVARYASGQVFGLSAFPVEYEVESEEDIPVEREYENIDVLESRFRPDPSDPLTLERAAAMNYELKKQLKNAKKTEKPSGATVPVVEQSGDISPQE